VIVNTAPPSGAVRFDVTSARVLVTWIYEMIRRNARL